MRGTDAISRSAVLAVGNVRKVVEYDEAGYDMTYNAVPVDVIEELPALDVAPVVHARWVYHWFDSYCSNCNYENRADSGTRIRHDTKFCPNCGARMDGEIDA